MPRSYLSLENGKTTITKGSDNAYSYTESVMLGNTDFDAIYNPITAFNFVLEVEGVYFLPLKSIRTFTKENEYEYIREGGVNDYVHMKRKPISKPFTFQIEKYIGTERFLDPLANGTELVLPLVLYIYRHKSRQGISESAPAFPARIYIFTGCTVMSKEYGELNAEKSGLLTEVTTIAYRELIVIPNPKQSGSELTEWGFDEKNLTKNKYAIPSPLDQDSETNRYKAVPSKQGLPKVSAKEKFDTLVKPAWDGSKGSARKYAYQILNNKNLEDKDNENVYIYPDDKDYELDKSGKLPSWKKSKTARLNRPAWDGNYGVVPRYAERSEDDKNDRTYTVNEGSLPRVVRKDKSKINKPAWDGNYGVKPRHAIRSDPDVADKTYNVNEGVLPRVTRQDESYLYKKPWSGKDGAVPVHAISSAPDAANTTYSVSEGSYPRVTRKDNSKLNKPSWIGTDGAVTRYAIDNSKGKPKTTPVKWPPTERALKANSLKK